MTDTLAVTVGGIIPVNISGIARVELLELLGVGGFGSVWKVKDCASNTLYVLKIIMGLKEGSIMVERVRLEASVKIPSPHIVPVLGLREWDSHTFLILFAYSPGKSLDQFIIGAGLTARQKRTIFADILKGVSAAHSYNIIHRDLKPANILIESDGKVKIIDFGISKFRGKDITASGEFLGTPHYAAPELLVYGSNVADARVDIYALGHLLYELSMGEHFWQHKGWNKLEDFVNYVNKHPGLVDGIELRDFGCAFHPDATKILAKMIKIDPEQRYQAVDEILEAWGYPVEIAELPSGLNFEYPLLIVESISNRDARTFVNIQPGKTLVLGRAEIAGADGSISRQHLEFSRTDKTYFVRDKGSKNGTLLRGKKLGETPQELRHGDRLKVGDVFLRFCFSNTR